MKNLLYICIINSGITETKSLKRRLKAGVAQLVERDLAKVEVASSNLVSRSKYKDVATSNVFIITTFQRLISLNMLPGWWNW